VGCGSWLTNAAGSSIGGFFDTDGDPLYAQGGDQGRAALRYYLSRSLVNGFVGDDRKGWSIAAPELERAVAIAAQHILSDRAGMLEVIEHSQLRAPDLRGTIDSFNGPVPPVAGRSRGADLYGRDYRPHRAV
jgi:hypothetical protein